MHRTLETPSAPGTHRHSSYSAPAMASTDTADAQSVTSAPSQSEGEETDEHIDESADENIDESVDESVAATPVQGPGASVQSGLTVCVFVGGP